LFLIEGLVLAALVLGTPLFDFVMPSCGGSGCTRRAYTAKTSILLAHKQDPKQGMIEYPGEKGLVKQMVKSFPGLKEIHFGHALHGVAPLGSFLVEEWDSLDNINEDLFDTLTNATSMPAITWTRKSYAPSSVETYTCPSQRIGHIHHTVSRSCSAVWKVVTSPSFCAWIPGCKLLVPTKVAAHSKVLTEGGQQLDAAVKRDKKNRRIEVSVLEAMDGYSGALWLERNGWWSCKVHYFFRVLDQDGLKGSTEKVFHEKFVPSLHNRLE